MRQLVQHLFCTMSAKMAPQSQKHIPDLAAMSTRITLHICKHKSMNIDVTNTHQKHVEWRSKYWLQYQFFIHFTSINQCGFKRKINCTQKQYLKIFFFRPLVVKVLEACWWAFLTTRNEHAADGASGETRRQGTGEGLIPGKIHFIDTQQT